MSLLFESSFYSFAFYVAINALIMLVLGILVTRARVKTQTGIGDGGNNPAMNGPFRAHANNTEYVPMALLLMWVLCLPAISGSIWLIHGIGAPLTIGRILHGIALSRSTGPYAAAPGRHGADMDRLHRGHCRRALSRLLGYRVDDGSSNGVLIPWQRNTIHKLFLRS